MSVKLYKLMITLVLCCKLVSRHDPQSNWYIGVLLLGKMKDWWQGEWSKVSSEGVMPCHATPCNVMQWRYGGIRSGTI